MKSKKAGRELAFFVAYSILLFPRVRLVILAFMRKVKREGRPCENHKIVLTKPAEPKTEARGHRKKDEHDFGC
jgi:hypothetical protein